ncbi:NERD domain-containing protein, partial [Streptomyces fradiae]
GRGGVVVPAPRVYAGAPAANPRVAGPPPPVRDVALPHLDRVLSGLSPVLSPDQAAHIYSVARQARTWTG